MNRGGLFLVPKLQPGNACPRSSSFEAWPARLSCRLPYGEVTASESHTIVAKQSFADMCSHAGAWEQADQAEAENELDGLVA